jgi:hypothetical protein
VHPLKMFASTTVDAHNYAGLVQSRNSFGGVYRERRCFMRSAKRVNLHCYPVNDTITLIEEEAREGSALKQNAVRPRWIARCSIGLMINLKNKSVIWED